MDKVWELDWIFNKEHGSIVSNHIIVSFLCVELNSESSRISVGICSSLLSSYSREPKEQWSSFSYRVEEFGFAVFRDVISDLKISMGASSLGMNHSFRDPFPIEFGEFIDKVEVL